MSLGIYILKYVDNTASKIENDCMDGKLLKKYVV
jgi:hypothetical protein